jgi:hypothetical protein
MPRPKLSEEERKARKQARNKVHYQQVKDSIKEAYKAVHKESLVYLINGLENDKRYVGVSNVFEHRKKKHITAFGNVQIEPIIRFTSIVPVGVLNYFESLIIEYYVGTDKCINTYNLKCCSKDTIMSYLHYVRSEYHELIFECLKKLDSDPPANPNVA